MKTNKLKSTDLMRVDGKTKKVVTNFSNSSHALVGKFVSFCGKKRGMSLGNSLEQLIPKANISFF